jgi:hypothetical protein
MQTIFQFRNGCRLTGSAQAVGERLEALRKKAAALTPELVLSDAKSTRSPLHRYFEWDDTLAAQKYRIDQAGDLIRSVQVTYLDIDPTESRQVLIEGMPPENSMQANPVRAFVAIMLEDGERL